jgi:hypothetical protein
MLYGVFYDVLRPVDDHPTGPRYRAVLADSPADAATQVGAFYGAKHVHDVHVRKVERLPRFCFSEGC